MKPYHANIEDETLNNENYRKVLYTAKQMQLVVMTLQKGEIIPMEVHHDIDQFIRVEEGSAEVEIDGEKFQLEDDHVIIIPSGAKHEVRNTADGKLKLYSIYTPPEHPDGTIHKDFAEAEKYEEEHQH
jgi:mannose-6-phosphate isomerase-like protein (cupin superfamily)